MKNLCLVLEHIVDDLNNPKLVINPDQILFDCGGNCLPFAFGVVAMSRTNEREDANKKMKKERS